jgi:hypothetical protein
MARILPWQCETIVSPIMARTDPPVFFVSYAREDAEYPEYRENLRKFVGDLSAKVANRLATPLEGVAFMDTDIQAGERWSDSLGDALMRSRVGLALYTPRYFTRRWCGKEFQIFLKRNRPGRGRTGIIPVRWEKRFPDPPECAAQIQHDAGAFPPEYASMGMHQLVKLKSVSPKEYENALDVLADRIVDEANAKSLAPLAKLDFDAIESAWEASTASDPKSHTVGNISKTCFVFIAHNGWDWNPYQGRPAQIGALAQKITGELGLKYEEIPCNAALPQKLKEANENEVPTVLLGDPASLASECYAEPMRQYDAQYLLNCAALMAWEPSAKDGIETDPRWVHLRTKVCKQKVENPPPYHEWRSIFSQDELDLKMRTLIEQMRSRLLKLLMSDPSRASARRKAEDPAISHNAAALGIITASLSHLEGPS